MSGMQVVKTVTVPATPDAAFRRFTEELDTWWPRATHSVFLEACAEARMEGEVGGRLYEISEAGEESEWGRVTAWEPPGRVAFTWHPGRGADTAQHVEVTFRAVEGGTELHLVHTGWERLGDEAEELVSGYRSGWEVVLGRWSASLEAA